MQTHTMFRRTTTWLAVVLATNWFTGPVAAQSPEEGPTRFQQVVRIVADETHLELIEKFSKDVELKNRIVRVDGFDESVVKVTPLERQPNRVRLEAVSQGVTSVVLVDETNQSFLVEVFVKGDARHLQTIINAKFPDSAVEVFKIQDSVVLRGWVTQPTHITQIVEIAEQFYPAVLNQMSLGGVQQVLLKVKVIEVQRAKIRQMGFNFLYLNENGYLASTPGQLTQVGQITLPLGGGPSLMFNQASLAEASLSFGFADDNNLFQGFFEALKEESLLKILAEPEIVTLNGRPATLLSGGEFPILVPQSLGTVTIQWREFGVRLEAVPIILGEGRLRLELQPEVSERDFTNAVDIAGTSVPGLTTRRVNTQVEMNFGQSLMIAGLIATRQTAESDKIPVLGDLPWIGAAFRRVRYDNVETDLVVMVTPELVAPLNQEQVPFGGPGLFTQTPTDRELYRDGMLEIPYTGDGAACEPNCPTPGMIVPPGAITTPGSMPPPIVLPPAAPPADGSVNRSVPPAPATSQTKSSAAQPGLVSWQPRFGESASSSTTAVRKVDLSNSLIEPASQAGPASAGGSTSENSKGTAKLQLSSRPGLIAPSTSSATGPQLR